jgi:hypothetical protein
LRESNVDAARQHLATANALSEDGDVAGAEAEYLAAVRADPVWSVPLYNLGLLCKYQGRWRESLEYNQRAAQLAPDDEAAWWNLGIAATALGDWAEARRAWAACQIELAAGDGPPHADFGHVPIRLDPDGSGEVVWGHRIDPARARLVSVPLPWSSSHWGDLVLHDGAVEGHRVVNGIEYPVFNALATLVASPYRTFVLELASTSVGAIDALHVIADRHQAAVENWGASTRALCRQCSLGIPHEHRADDAQGAHPHCGLAALDAAHAELILNEWLSSAPGSDVLRWYPASDAIP